MNESAVPPDAVARIKRAMVWGLGVLWLIDAGLRYQPRMFTLDFVSDIMKPSIASNPSFLGSLSSWTMSWVSPHIGQWNWVFASTQFFIAVALLYGLIRQHPRAIRMGLVVSILWGCVVWIFGEGTSGVFTGNGSLLSGGPGSVLLYVVIAVLCLLPESEWRRSARFCLPRDALALFFLYGGVVSVLTAGYWGPRGLPILIEGQASMAPSWMVSTLTPAVAITHADPVFWNAVYSISLFAIAGLLCGRRPKAIGFWLLAVVLLLMWYWGQALGGVFSGMGTDLNTPPLFALLAIPAWAVWRSRHRSGALAGLASDRAVQQLAH